MPPLPVVDGPVILINIVDNTNRLLRPTNVKMMEQEARITANNLLPTIMQQRESDLARQMITTLTPTLMRTKTPAREADP
eukprot:3928663-Ditylum_brightwellii.AAC.1